MITSQFKTTQFGNTLDGESDRVELPFGHLWFYWTNGNPQADPKEGAYHHGGWASDAEKFDPGIVNQDATPAGVIGPKTWRNREGKDYQVFATRALYAAPIATRYYFDDKGGHIAILCYLATVAPNEKGVSTLQPYGPAVLTANGYSAGNLKQAFKLWQSQTAAARAEFAPGVPANLFYVKIGALAAKRAQVMVGKPGKQSPVVPPQIQEIEWTDAELSKYFVGDDVAAIMLALKEQAQEWLKDIPETAKGKKDAVNPNASLDELNAALGNNNVDTDFPI